MAMQWTSASQATTVGGAKMCVYGPSGMGKTVLSATLPAPVLISAESGALSLRRANLERLFGVGTAGITYDIPMIVVQSVDDLTAAYDWCARAPEAAQFQSVALDSISEIGEVVLANAKRQVKDPRQAYGELIEKMTNLIRLFRDLPKKHVYMAAKMEANKDELTSTTRFGPSMPGVKLAQQLPYFFDEVFRLGTNKDANGTPYRFLQTQPDIQYEAKDRSGMLGPIEYPHLGAVIAKMLAA